ncbi:hypothetical protein YC2023_020643 [Brassica napus]
MCAGSDRELGEWDYTCWTQRKNNWSSSESLKISKLCYNRFGPAGDPRGAGIGTPEAIKLVWSCHREIIYDYGPVPQGWELPAST